jgi:O-antigen ligase
MTRVLSLVRLYGFYLLVFVLPWQTRWIMSDAQINGGVWEYGRVSVYGFDVLLLMLLSLSLPELKLTFKQALPPRHQQVAAFVLFLTLGFASTLWATDPVLVLYWGLRLVEAGAFWLLYRTCKPKLEQVWLSLCVTGVVQGLWGVQQFLSQSTFASKWLGVADHPLSQPGTSVVLTSTGRWLRAYGGQVHPNVLGGLLVVTILTTVWLCLTCRTRSARYLTLVAIIAQAAGLFFSFSRGAWAALLIALVVWWLLHQSQRPALLLPALTVAVTLVSLAAIYWQPTQGRLFGGSRLEQQSLDDRVGEVGESKTLLSTTWLSGVGLGNYTRALHDAQPNLPSYRYQPVHNLFLLVFAELGVVGLGLLLWLLWQYLSGASLRYDLVFLAPILVVALLDHYWWTSASMLIIGFLALSLPAPEPTATPS